MNLSRRFASIAPLLLFRSSHVDGLYAPLDCNAAIAAAESCPGSTPLSALVDGAPDGDPVVVPCGSCAHVDYVDGEVLDLPHGLQVVGRLTFPSASNVVLNTTAVVVQGYLDIEPPSPGNEVRFVLKGSEEQFLYPHDGCGGGYDPSCDAKVPVGKKAVVVAGGQFNIQGVDGGCPSWTRLDRQVSETVLRVDRAFASCVKPGDEILIASSNTNWKDDIIRTVASVNLFDGEITLDSAIARTLPALTGPGEEEYAVEVARLTRSVVFTAIADDPEGDHVGGHLMVFQTDVPQTIQGARFDNFGQGGKLGRYPLHFHLCEDSFGSVVSKNVITNSNQRCVLIHGTNGVTVEDNVAWNTHGHCYATETGVEVNNVFKNNLGSRTKLLQFHNTQSDSINFWTGKHRATTFWVRNMNNEWVGNVAAGSESSGFWIEMKDLDGAQQSLGPVSSFRDNVAHSNKEVGFNTYKKGWKPVGEGGVLDNLTIYKNPGMGFKFHITGNVKVTNSLFADNGIHILSGVWNDQVTFENTVIDALTDDSKLRLGRTCPLGGGPAIKHAYNNDIEDPTLTLTGVTFANFQCGKDMFQFQNDGRQGPRSMGAPVKATGITLDNVNENSKPHFNCDWEARETFLEDADGTLSPQGVAAPGVVVRNTPKMLAFLPPESCTPVPYSGNDCSVFCEGACLRQVGIAPTFDGQTYTDLKLRLSNGSTEYTYSSAGYADFRIAVPTGNYHGVFLDDADAELIASRVEVTPYQEPLCADFVTASSFVFPTNEPTAAPTHGPTISAAPTIPGDPVVRVKSVVNGRYLWVRVDGGLTASSDATPLENTAIALKKVPCLGSGYFFDKGNPTPCYLLQWEHGRRLGAKSGQSWKNGVYAKTGAVANDNHWYLHPIECGVAGPPANSCTLLRNAWNGRALYDSTGSTKVLGASPPGDPGSYITEATHYRWNLVDAESGIELNVNGL